MKLLALTFAISVFFLQTMQAQDSSKKVNEQDTLLNSKPLNLAIKRFHAREVTGYLATIKDSAIFVSPTPVQMNFTNAHFDLLQKVDYSTINVARLYNKKKTGRTFLICALTGVVAGALLGYAGGDDTGWFGLSAGAKAFLGGILGGGAGCIIGGIAVQGMQKKFYIKGEWINLEDMKNSLQSNK